MPVDSAAPVLVAVPAGQLWRHDQVHEPCEAAVRPPPEGPRLVLRVQDLVLEGGDESDWL